MGHFIETITCPRIPHWRADTPCNNSTLIVRLVLTISLLICFQIATTKVSAQPTNDAQITELNRNFNRLSSQIYRYYADSEKHKLNDIRQLEQQVRQLGDDKGISAIALITGNLEIIKNNIDDTSIFYFIALLLKYNELGTANDLFSTIKTDGEKSLISNASFAFAKYYLSQNSWQAVIDSLNGTFDDLATEDANYAYLISGIALQRLKEHRKAIDYYNEVPQASKYYPHAQLNTAIAYIRQGWWTDAHLKIAALLRNNQIDMADEVINRLYLVLGYSLLQKEYYRDSREAFRNIGINSQYKNRALLGIALSAENQEDHIGALKVLALLKDRNTAELSVDESYLLIAYIYRKIEQNMTASASYSAAIEHYEKRIHGIDLLLRNKEALHSLVNPSASNGSVILDENLSEFNEALPRSLLEHTVIIKGLIDFLKKPSNEIEKDYLEQLNNLQDQYQGMLSELIGHFLTQRKKYLQSYISQSRFGLARLYDSSESNAQVNHAPN